MNQNPRTSYKGIYFMLLAAAAFAVMSGFAKVLKPHYDAAQLVFFRNMVGLLALLPSFLIKPVKQSGGRFGLLLFRGIMGSFALYTLLFNILHLTIGAAMTYNSINTFYIALIGGWFLKEKLNSISWVCIVLGFIGVLLIYRPDIDFNWQYHAIGLLHGLFSAMAYLSIGSLNKYYDTRIIVLSFLVSGIVLPLLGMCIGATGWVATDHFFFPEFPTISSDSLWYLAGMGISALLGQYFVTLAYSNDKAGIVAAIGYSNIVFGLMVGIVLGDPNPGWIASIGILLVILSGVILSLFKNKMPEKKE
ncbi:MULTISPECIES: DMT family transporter [unclassified Paraflavitalea]|uniref:DMT family transporter n=1 Tax=unclassified Paraflavitalea TaxID=2798305 RepID=UPI003D34EED8